jgi:hypothetical protein
MNGHTVLEPPRLGPRRVRRNPLTADPLALLLPGRPLSPEAFLERLDLPRPGRGSGPRLPLSGDDLTLLREMREDRSPAVPFDADPGVRRAPAPPPSAGALASAGRVRKAAVQAMGELFDSPFGIPREALGAVVAQTPAQARGIMGTVRSFNDVFIRGTSQGIDMAARGALAPFAGAVAGISQAAQELGLSPTGARRLERDLTGLMVSAGVTTGAGARGAPVRPPRPSRLLAEADRRGILDKAIRDLPPGRQANARDRLREAFREGHKTAGEAVRGAKGRMRPPAASGVSGGEIARGARPPLTELPAVSRTVNPMTADEFAKLPNQGFVDPARIRTLQRGVSSQFNPSRSMGSSPTLLDTVNQLRANAVVADRIPPVRIFERNGQVFTLDHRRIVAHRLAGVRVRFRKSSVEDVIKELHGKLDTKDEGLSIRIRVGSKRRK